MRNEKIPKSRRKSQIKAVNKYAREHYDRIGLYTPVGTKDRWTVSAKEHGFDSLAPFVRYCVEKVIASGVDDSENNDTIVNN